jgi:predicted deacylase
MLARPYTPVRRPVWLSAAGARIAADSAGAFIASVDRDARVTKGQLLGYTTDFLGRKTGEVRSPIDGLVTFIRGVPSMWPRATLVNVLPVLQAPLPWKAPTPR